MLASKFEKYGTVSYVRENGKIIAICAGYTNDQVQRLGYISVVASLPEYTNKGYGKVAVQGFIEKAKNAGMKAICKRSLSAASRAAFPGQSGPY